MNLLTKSLALLGLIIASCKGDENYQINYGDGNASRENTKVKWIYQISAQGSHTPKKFLEMSKSTEDEDKQKDYVTPLGIRQQYMIGDELRYRYIEDQKRSEQYEFLADLYDITQIYIQTSWNDTSILSAQAMLLGIYPPGKNNYKIKEDQKYNAVPPVEGFNFKPWIDEMDLSALPFQTTIFPIQMNGWSYDFMLALDNDNCKTAKTQRDSAQEAISKDVVELIAKKEQWVQDLFDKEENKPWQTLCNYINWAYIESIDLKEDSVKDIEVIYSTCQDAKNIEINKFSSLEDSTILKGVSSNDLRKDMSQRITQWLSKQQVDTKETGENKKPNLEGTAGSNDPLYYMYWTNEDLLSLFAHSLVTVTDDSKLSPLGPSSTIVLEFSSDEKGDTIVKGFVDDQAVKLKGCIGELSCKATDFQQSIEKGVQIPNVQEFCNPQSSKM